MTSSSVGKRVGGSFWHLNANQWRTMLFHSVVTVVGLSVILAWPWLVSRCIRCITSLLIQTIFASFERRKEMTTCCWHDLMMKCTRPPCFSQPTRCHATSLVKWILLMNPRWRDWEPTVASCTECFLLIDPTLMIGETSLCWIESEWMEHSFASNVCVLCVKGRSILTCWM